MTTRTNHRIIEIDFIRGIAIILMIVFHLIVDLKDFYGYPFDYLHGFWYIEGKISVFLFILICGVSSTLGQHNTLHGIQVFAWAMVLTGITYFYNKQCYILFGILHFLGISLLSANRLNGFSLLLLSLLSVGSIIIGTFFGQRFIDNPYLFPLGLVNNSFISLDYYPLFPWYGVFVLGIIIGKLLYGGKKRLGFCQVSAANKLITKLGQHSLKIYLLHQPIFLILLYVIHTIFS